MDVEGRPPRRAGRPLLLAAATAAALVVPLVAVAASRGDGRTPAAMPAFQKDVAPIIRQKCAGCHQTGGIAPFPLTTAAQAQGKAALIARAVGAGVMPPWPPGARSPDYVGQETHRLTAGERSTLLRWARSGGRAAGPGAGRPAAARPDVRAGERVLDLAMPSPYTPSAADGATDDYRCFLLDPKLDADAYATSVRIVPGSTRAVHHVILFRAAAAAGAEARALDARSAAPGWPCFGGVGVSTQAAGMDARQALDDASWIAAWAPGWGSGRLTDGIGVPLPRGSLVVMQVHYNLLNGKARDRSRAVLTVAPPDGLEPVETVLLPAPVELACTARERGPLCERDRALADLARKYGSVAAFVPAGLLFLCGQDAAAPKPSRTSVCDRKVDGAATIHSVAGHMHLLGASIRLELNPGTPAARVLLDIPRWDFHWQNVYFLQQPVAVGPGDVIRVTCRFDQSRRARGEEGIPRTPRYVLWGEGTTDEMCLGVVQVTRG